ncbi:CCT domain containing protein [Parasponia andersonii]|uniref:CCT domain containing protein n=1 Tax=Parasponia andersonii TaxID=3476 RepID=A0A2P5CTK3_PARAD|nr:CCT domain containing protein [Parasponia andersonii]
MMCNKNNRLRLPRNRKRTRKRTRTRSLRKSDVVQSVRPPVKGVLPPARRSRTKTRKPKYLSLRLQLSKETTETETDAAVRTPSSEITEMTSSFYRHHQLNLFPLHPENLVDDDDRHAAAAADDSVALLFQTDGGASLSGLLPTAVAATMSSEEADSMSYHAALGVGRRRRFDREYGYLSVEEDRYYVEGGVDGRRSSMNSLVRTAMRNRERDRSEEKWVSYSEVVEEVTSSSCSTEILGKNKKKKKLLETTSFQRQNNNSSSSSSGTNLALKLDYQEILKAWSDKGSLYIQGDSPQTVPDLHDNTTHGLIDGWGSAGNLWKVPEGEGNVSSLKIKEELESKDSWKMGQREASVLRYKEKRQSRLFSKRIRYEVRKLNAEKRPRMKGRFVKIS